MKGSDSSSIAAVSPEREGSGTMGKCGKRPRCNLTAKIRLVNSLGATSEENEKNGRIKIETTVTRKLESVMKISKVE